MPGKYLHVELLETVNTIPKGRKGIVVGHRTGEYAVKWSGYTNITSVYISQVKVLGRTDWDGKGPSFPV